MKDHPQYRQDRRRNAGLLSTKEQKGIGRVRHRKKRDDKKESFEIIVKFADREFQGRGVEILYRPRLLVNEKNDQQQGDNDRDRCEEKDLLVFGGLREIGVGRYPR